MKCLIISAGDYYIPDNTKEYDFIIACDKGYQYCQMANIRPNLILGDFDSYHQKLNTDVDVITYPIEKDDTDTMLAIKKALELGYNDITICCCFGGRLDHTFANIQSAAYLVSKNCTVKLLSSDTILYCISDNSIEIERIDNYSLSIFSLTDKVENLTIKGAKYEVEGVTLTNTFPLGVSNYWINNKVQISCGKGILIIICSSKEKEI